MRSLGSRTKVVAVSSIAPPSGIEDLIAALDEHRAQLDLPKTRTAARRASALADFAAEHGERGVRELGGRRAATEFLEQQDDGLDVPALTAALEARRG
jgi:LAO/AO transport system kinase